MAERINLAARPVPDSMAAMSRKAGYRTDVPIALGEALASEACIDVRTRIAGRNHYNATYNPPYCLQIPGSVPELYLRQSVADLLLAVNDRLAAQGLQLYLYDAWRPQAVQRYFHDVWFPEWLVARWPDLQGPALLEEVEKYWAAPTTHESSPSPHATGGAVDLTLADLSTGCPLFMGSIFDDVTEIAWTDWCERRPPLSMSDAEARANRRRLYWTMTEAGFANNPTEWWHFSWGDQMWAQLTGATAAHYGAWTPAESDGPI